MLKGRSEYKQKSYHVDAHSTRASMTDARTESPSVCFEDSELVLEFVRTRFVDSGTGAEKPLKNRFITNGLQIQIEYVSR
jgi:hypothetical protein